MCYLLNSERHKNCKAFCCKSSHHLYLSHTDRKSSIKTVHLLPLKDRELAKLLSCRSHDGFRVIIKLLLGICHVNQSEDSKHHPLVSCGQILQELLCLLSLKLQVIGEHGGEIVVGILTALPVGGIRLNTKHKVFNLPYSLICRNRHYIYAEHQIARDVGKLSNYVVLDIVGVIFKEHDSSVLLAQHEIVIKHFDAVR